MSIEFMTIVCDICKERPMKITKKINGKWTGLCSECDISAKKEKDDKQGGKAGLN